MKDESPVNDIPEDELQQAFVAEVGIHRAKNSRTGELLGIPQDKELPRQQWQITE